MNKLLDFDKLDYYETYCFELVSRVNKVVIDYKEPKLYHIFTRNNFDFNEIYYEDIGVEKPRRFDFGSKKDDHCFVADYNGKIIGAVWVRILNGEIKGYGNVDDETPEFSISLFKEYRNQGIGTAMMKKMIDYLNKKGYSQASLSVQKGNYASKLYKKLGFEVIKDENEDYLMVLKLSKLSKNL